MMLSEAAALQAGSFDLSGLPPGAFHLQLLDDNGKVLANRLVVRR